MRCTSFVVQGLWVSLLVAPSGASPEPDGLPPQEVEPARVPAGTPPPDPMRAAEASIRDALERSQNPSREGDRETRERLETLERRMLALARERRDLDDRLGKLEVALMDVRTSLRDLTEAKLPDLESSIANAAEIARSSRVAEREVLGPNLKKIETLVESHSAILERLTTRLDFALTLLSADEEPNPADAEAEPAKPTPPSKGRSPAEGAAPGPGGPSKQPPRKNPRATSGEPGSGAGG
jgi:hypothetical protein